MNATITPDQVYPIANNFGFVNQAGVNLLTGDVNLDIPLASLSGLSLHYVVRAFYNSRSTALSDKITNVLGGYGWKLMDYPKIVQDGESYYFLDGQAAYKLVSNATTWFPGGSYYLWKVYCNEDSNPPSWKIRTEKGIQYVLGNVSEHSSYKFWHLSLIQDLISLDTITFSYNGNQLNCISNNLGEKLRFSYEEELLSRIDFYRRTSSAPSNSNQTVNQLKLIYSDSQIRLLSQIKSLHRIFTNFLPELTGFLAEPSADLKFDYSSDSQPNPYTLLEVTNASGAVRSYKYYNGGELQENGRLTNLRPVICSWLKNGYSDGLPEGKVCLGILYNFNNWRYDEQNIYAQFNEVKEYPGGNPHNDNPTYPYGHQAHYFFNGKNSSELIELPTNYGSVDVQSWVMRGITYYTKTLNNQNDTKPVSSAKFYWQKGHYLSDNRAAFPKLLRSITELDEVDKTIEYTYSDTFHLPIEIQTTRRNPKLRQEAYFHKEQVKITVKYAFQKYLELKELNILTASAQITELVKEPSREQGLYFNGSNTYVDCGMDTQLSFAGSRSYTFEAWIKPDDAQANGVILSKFNYQNVGEYMLYLHEGKVNSHRNVEPWLIVGSTLLKANTWYHIATTYEPSLGNQGILRIYINGQLEIEKDQFGYQNSAATNVNFIIGADYNKNQVKDFFKGTICHVAIWQTARTETQIQFDMENFPQAKEKELVSYWPLNEGRDSTAYNSSRNSINGSIQNPFWQEMPVPHGIWQVIGSQTVHWQKWDSRQWNAWKIYVLKQQISESELNKGLEDTPTSNYWMKTIEVIKRNEFGLVEEAEDANTLRSFTIYDKIHNAYLIASFTNASRNQAGYYSFENYEPEHGWTLNGGSIIDTTAHTGKRCYKGQNIHVSYERFDAKLNSDYVISAYVKLNPSGYCTIGFKPKNDSSNWGEKVSYNGSDQWLHLKVLERVANNPNKKINAIPTIECTNGFINNVQFAPVGALFAATVYDFNKKLVTASFDTNGEIIRTVYDLFDNPIATVGPKEQVKKLVLPYNSRKGNANFSKQEGFDPNYPNMVLEILANNGGVWERFQFADNPNFPVDGLKNMSVSNGLLVSNSSIAPPDNEGTALFTSVIILDPNYAVYIDILHSGAEENQEMGISLRNKEDNIKISLTRFGRKDHSGQLTFKSTGAASLVIANVTDVRVPLSLLLIVLEGKHLFVYGNGRFLFKQTFNDTLTGPVKLFSTNPGGCFANFFFIKDPILSNTTYDARGRQRQFLAKADPARVHITESLYGGELNLFAAQTKGTLLNDDSGGKLLYRQNFVTFDKSKMEVTGGSIQQVWTDYASTPFSYSKVHNNTPLLRTNTVGTGGVYTAGHANGKSRRFEYTKNSGEYFQFAPGELNLTISKGLDGLEKRIYTNQNNNIFGKVLIGDSEQHLQQYVYDKAMRLAVIYHPNFFAKSPNIFERDKFCDNYTYDFLGNTCSKTTTDTGTTNFRYDQVGRLRLMQDANGVNASQHYCLYWKYDALGRIVEEGTYNGDINDMPQSELDKPSWPISGIWKKKYRYDTNTKTNKDDIFLGRLTQIITKNTKEIFRYDEDGNVTEYLLWLEEDRKVAIVYSYNQLNNVTRIKIGTDYDVTYTYDRLGRVSAVGTPENPNYYATYRYENGKIVEKLNNETITRTYQTNAAGWIEQIEDEFFKEKLYYHERKNGSEGYYNGQVASAEYQFKWSNAPGGYSYEYYYDKFGRLLRAEKQTENQGTVGAGQNIIYDPNGNILTLYQGNVSTTYTYNSGTNQVKKTSKNATYSYDNNGNIIASSQLNKIGYDPLTQLTLEIQKPGVDPISFNYDGWNRRVMKKQGNNKTIYIHGLEDYPLIERTTTESEATFSIAYIYGPMGRIAMKQIYQKWELEKVGDDYYQIVAKHSEKVLDVQDGSTEDEANVWQYSKNGTDAQKWKLEDAGNGYYQIVAKHSKKVLDVQNGSTEDGANVWQYSKNDTDAQKWKLEDAGNGYKYIVAKHSGKVLEVKAAITKSKANVIQGLIYNQRERDLFILKDRQGSTRVVLASSSWSDKAVIYADLNYEGRSKELGVGDYRMAQLGIDKDTLSSLKVPLGLEVILYENDDFKGRSKSFTQDNPYVGEDFNDITSSIQVKLNPIAYFNYLPFGDLITSISNAGNGFPIRYRYTGQEYDKETGLYNFRARMYDLSLARFYAPDPLRQFASPYRYSDNPLSFADPTGEWFGLDNLIVAGIGSVVGAVSGLIYGIALKKNLLKEAFTGAISGAAAAEAALFTGGAASVLLGKLGVESSIFRGIVIGAVSGFVGGAISGAGGKSEGESVGYGALFGLISGGALGGASGVWSRWRINSLTERFKNPETALGLYDRGQYKPYLQTRSAQFNSWRFVNKGDNLSDAVARIMKETRRGQVMMIAAHGNSQQIEGHTIDEFVSLLKKNSFKGAGITMIVCDVGNKQVAGRLANELSVPVYASPKQVDISVRGSDLLYNNPDSDFSIFFPRGMEGALHHLLGYGL